MRNESYAEDLSEVRPEKRTIRLKAKPENIILDLSQTALIVVDMQNAFCSKGGMVNLVGMDIGPIRTIIEPCARLINAMRRAGCRIIYLQTGFDLGLHSSGGANCPYWYKGIALKLMRERPDLLDGKPLIFGTNDAEIISELAPNKDDVVIKKQRYSGFYGTNLDQTLFTNNIRTLIFSGVATNVCVESTIRDAFFRNYFPVIVADAVQHLGPDFCQEATLYNVERYFGWVTMHEDILEALKELEGEG